MDRLSGAVIWLRSLARRSAAEREMDEELSFHIEMEARRNEADGLPPLEARRRALVAFGGMERHREAMREGRRLAWLEDLVLDLRFAGRGLLKRPGFTVVAMLTIGLGVGATTAIFSMANTMLLRPLPVSEPDRLVLLNEQRTGSVWTTNGVSGIPYERYEEYAAATAEVFSGVAGEHHRVLSLRMADETAAVGGTLATGNYFVVLGVQPALGRLFDGVDEPVAVVSDRLWRTRFGADPGVIGRTVYLDSRPYTVTGVLPPSFTGTSSILLADVWVPIRAYPAGAGANRAMWVIPFARLRPGATRAQATALVDVAARRIPPREPQTRVQGVRLDPLTGIPGEGRTIAFGFLGMLFATALLVLCIASANIAGVLVARGVARRREVAVRLAIGARRGRLVRQLLAENLLLFLLGGAAGVMVAVGGTRLLSSIRVPGEETIAFDFSPDARVLGFALAITAIAGLLFGLLPALQASRPDLVRVLKDGAPGAGRRSNRARNLFVGVQLALSVVLLVIAGLFVRSLQTGLAVEPGSRVDGVLVAAAGLGPHGYDEARGRAYFTELVERVRGLPGVEGAALGQVVLLSGNALGNDVRPVQEGSPEERTYPVRWNTVDPEYFSTIQVELVAGRGFTAADGPGAPPVTIINETLAARLWPGENPIGRRLRAGPEELEVVGAVRDGRYVTLTEAPIAFAFRPFAQQYQPTMNLHVASSGNLTALAARIREEARAVDPNVALERVAPMSSLVGMSLFPQRFAAWLIGLFGALGLLLAGIGVYGVLAFNVAQRTREFGIRTALGATARDVVRAVVMRGARLAALGTLVGLALAAAVTHLLRGLLYGISPLDPVTFTSVGLLLASVAVCASYFPARRAVRVNPAEALRAE